MNKNLSISLHPSLLATVMSGIIFGFAQPVGAVNYILNGNFETTVSGTDKQLGYATDNQAHKTDATSWSTTGYNFLFSPGRADVGGATNGSTTGSSAVFFWSSNNGGSTPIPSTSPAGGNFIAADGNFQVGAITQQINNLTIGQKYELSFYWAAAQQKGYDGPTTSKWQVSLGSQTLNTPVYSLPNHGFSGWMQQTLTFTADSAAPILSFLSVGTPPAGLPPFALLDGVSMVAVPEPSTCLIGGILLCGIAFRRQRRTP